ncbi:TPA: hypothetical protein DHW51_18065, partial [Candidatus Poribacteria bacterium]|nr:hypothetical protein [Candidatus Poribacteria bacterium]
MVGTEPHVERQVIFPIVALEVAVVQVVEEGVDADPVALFFYDEPVEPGVTESRVERGALHQVEHV